jgi:hypothetical protein
VSPRGVTFELERFSVSPVTAEVVLLEVEGRLAGASPRAPSPRLLVEPATGARREHTPVDASLRDRLLRVSFAVPARDAAAPGLALAVGGLLLDLPAPDPMTAADRTVALSREVNVLRHELTALHAELAEGREAAAGHAAELERQERAVAEREAAVERRVAEREAAADQAAGARIEEVEREASEREAELARAASERQAELERSASELGQVLADVRAVTEERDAAAATELARLHEELDAARDAATAANARAAGLSREERAARAELEALRRTLDQREQELRAAAPAPRSRAVAAPSVTVEDPVTTAVHAADNDDTTVGIPADDDTTVERPADDDTTVERPADDSIEPPDTGPIPLRRGSGRGAVATLDPDDGAQSETVRVLGRDRPRASALPPPPDADPGPPPGPSSRTLALAALVLAALLILVAILGFLL